MILGMTIAQLAQLLITYGPDAVKAIVNLFSQSTPPTAAQWDALFLVVKQTNYDAYIAQAKANAGLPA
jgi:hypothetical protein